MAHRRPSATSPHMVDGSDDGASCSEATNYLHPSDKTYEKGAMPFVQPLDHVDQTYEKGTHHFVESMDHVDHGEGCPFWQEKIELTQETGYKSTGFAYPTWKKWGMISVIFVVQCSMNMNASLYGNAVDGMMETFHISASTARYGQMAFLVFYGFGCELWAPWSEELGRRPVMQASLFFVNLWHIPCALAPNFATVLIFRMLGGLSCAGGSVTMSVVADMWSADDQQYAIAYVVFSSVGGSVIGPVVGGFIQTYLSWHWCFWTMFLFGVFTQTLHFLYVPETRTTILLDREAQRRRKLGEKNIWGPGELHPHEQSWSEIAAIWMRPFIMFGTEPIVLCLSLLSGFSDALIFTFFDAYHPVYSQWNFTNIQVGLSFAPLALGYLVAYFSFFPGISKQRKQRAAGKLLAPEVRLYWLLWTVPLLPLGLFGFAWTSSGPPMPFIVPMIFGLLVGVANYSVYMATIDYMCASYGPYSASATGGNGFARDVLAGFAALYSDPFYEGFGKGKWKFAWPSTILGIVALVVTVPVYVFYWCGPTIRAKSKFAQALAAEGKTDRAGVAGGKVGDAERQMSLRRLSVVPR